MSRKSKAKQATARPRKRASGWTSTLVDWISAFACVLSLMFIFRSYIFSLIKTLGLGVISATALVAIATIVLAAIARPILNVYLPWFTLHDVRFFFDKRR